MAEADLPTDSPPGDPDPADGTGDDRAAPGSPGGEDAAPRGGLAAGLVLVLAFVVATLGVGVLLFPFDDDQGPCGPPVYRLFIPEDRVDVVIRPEGDVTPCAAGARGRAALGFALVIGGVVLAVVADQVGKRSREARDARWLAGGGRSSVP